ncbi:MAG TPA: hypothetical protein PKG52_02615 [bacterium]|nr:hypothetical protein [bacterium]HPS29492.1 hypothetical protein [bacterium]
MTGIISRFEAFLMLQTTSKRKSLSLLFLGIMIPGPFKYMFVFLLISKLIYLDIAQKKMKMILSLPFSRAEIFVFSYILGLVIICCAAVTGESFFTGNVTPALIPELLVFYSAYFGVFSLVSMKGSSSITLPVFLLIVDLLAGLRGSFDTNVYSWISPLYHKEIIYASVFSMLILAVSFVQFIFNRREKW